ncbi:MAG TPA: NAD-dependent epimerase/dehydratase family protein, partial [Rhodopila sp.]|nr:NAD-dependent epimerase/dehydratase family protein [Rhodopila sp.]
MARKTVLVAGASGLVGSAVARHFAQVPEANVIALSRRPPPEPAARHLPLDLTDAAACDAAAREMAPELAPEL